MMGWIRNLYNQIRFLGNLEKSAFEKEKVLLPGTQADMNKLERCRMAAMPLYIELRTANSDEWPMVLRLIFQAVAHALVNLMRPPPVGIEPPTREGEAESLKIEAIIEDFFAVARKHLEG
jgi:hypothetical protein